MNKVILIGRLARDPELRYTESGKAYVRFTIAINRGKNQNGDDLGADFINCFAWEKLAENINKYTKKGSKVGISGKIRVTSKPLDDGTKKYFTEIQVTELEFLDRKPKEETPPYGEPTSADSAETMQSTAEITEDPFDSFASEVNPDDLPF